MFYQSIFHIRRGLIEAKIVDQSGSRHCKAWCMRSPITTARCPPERILTQQWQGEWPGVGTSQTYRRVDNCHSTSSAWPASTIGWQLWRNTFHGKTESAIGHTNH
jgi:hypothetical protein